MERNIGKDLRDYLGLNLEDIVAGHLYPRDEFYNGQCRTDIRYYLMLIYEMASEYTIIEEKLGRKLNCHEMSHVKDRFVEQVLRHFPR